MKRTLRVITAGACATSMAFALAGCTAQSGPESPSQSTSYESSQQSEEGSLSMNSQPNEVSGAGGSSQGAREEESSYSFDPSANENQDVYGPPRAFDPSDNYVEVLYGPPEIFESSDDSASSLDDELMDFDPSDNNMAVLYGPPDLIFRSRDADDLPEGDEGGFSDDANADDASASETNASDETNA